MQWLRLYHETPNDPKWRKVAVRSGQPVGNVLAVWTMMLVCASEAKERGTLEGWDDETVAAVLGYHPDAVTAIRTAMQGVVLDDDKLTGWAKRQRASDNTAERVAKHRKAKQTPPDGGSPGGNSPETSQEPSKANGAYCNADVTVTSRNVTLQSVDVTLPPLRAQTPDSQIEDSKSLPAPDIDSNPACTRTERLVGVVGGLTGLPSTAKNREIAEGWLRQGWDADLDIIPAVSTFARAPSYPLDQIRGFAFFTDMIDSHRAKRLNPQPLPAQNVHQFRPARSGNTNAGAQEFLALLARKQAEGS